LATNFLIAENVQTVKGIPANVKLYPAMGSALQLNPDGSGAAIPISPTSQFWTTSTEHSISSNDAVSGWVLHLVCTSQGSNQAYNLTINIYYKSDTGAGLLQRGHANSHDLHCDGANENLVLLSPQPWTSTPSVYHLNLEIHPRPLTAQTTILFRVFFQGE
jgi:hypothetical protein